MQNKGNKHYFSLIMLPKTEELSDSILFKESHARIADIKLTHTES